MLDFNDIFQLLMLIMVGVITCIELYSLIKKIKNPESIGRLNIVHREAPIIPPPVMPPNITTPYSTVGASGQSPFNH